MTARKTTTTRTTSRSKKTDTVLNEPLVEEVKVEKEAPVKKEPEKKAIREKIAIYGALTPAIMQAALVKMARACSIKPVMDPFYILKKLGAKFGLEPWQPGKGAEHTKEYFKRILEKYNAE